MKDPDRTLTPFQITLIIIAMITIWGFGVFLYYSFLKWKQGNPKFTWIPTGTEESGAEASGSGNTESWLSRLKDRRLDAAKDDCSKIWQKEWNPDSNKCVYKEGYKQYVNDCKAQHRRPSSNEQDFKQGKCGKCKLFYTEGKGDKEGECVSWFGKKGEVDEGQQGGDGSEGSESWLTKLIKKLRGDSKEGQVDDSKSLLENWSQYQNACKGINRKPGDDKQLISYTAEKDTEGFVLKDHCGDCKLFYRKDGDGKCVSWFSRSQSPESGSENTRLMDRIKRKIDTFKCNPYQKLDSSGKCVDMECLEGWSYNPEADPNKQCSKDGDFRHTWSSHAEKCKSEGRGVNKSQYIRDGRCANCEWTKMEDKLVKNADGRPNCVSRTQYHCNRNPMGTYNPNTKNCEPRQCLEGWKRDELSNQCEKSGEDPIKTMPSHNVYCASQNRKFGTEEDYLAGKCGGCKFLYTSSTPDGKCELPKIPNPFTALKRSNLRGQSNKLKVDPVDPHVSCTNLGRKTLSIDDNGDPTCGPCQKWWYKSSEKGNLQSKCVPFWTRQKQEGLLGGNDDSEKVKIIALEDIVSDAEAKAKAAEADAAIAQADATKIAAKLNPDAGMQKIIDGGYRIFTQEAKPTTKKRECTDGRGYTHDGSFCKPQDCNDPDWTKCNTAYRCIPKDLMADQNVKTYCA